MSIQDCGGTPGNALKVTLHHSQTRLWQPSFTPRWTGCIHKHSQTSHSGYSQTLRLQAQRWQLPKEALPHLENFRCCFKNRVAKKCCQHWCVTKMNGRDLSNEHGWPSLRNKGNFNNKELNNWVLAMKTNGNSEHPSCYLYIFEAVNEC